MMDYQLKLTDGTIVRPIRLEWGGQIAIIQGATGEVAVPRSIVEEIIFDNPALNKERLPEKVRKR